MWVTYVSLFFGFVFLSSPCGLVALIGVPFFSPFLMKRVQDSHWFLLDETYMWTRMQPFRVHPGLTREQKRNVPYTSPWLYPSFPLGVLDGYLSIRGEGSATLTTGFGFLPNSNRASTPYCTSFDTESHPSHIRLKTSSPTTASTKVETTSTPLRGTPSTYGSLLPILASNYSGTRTKVDPSSCYG